MEYQISFSLKYLSPSIDRSDLDPIQDAAFCVLFGSSYFSEFRAKYGHIILVFQELEMTLKTTLGYMKEAYEKHNITEYFEIDPSSASFYDLIEMFTTQLDSSKAGSLDFIGRLHEARKYRNRLAHTFVNSDSLEYHMSFGGRQKTLEAFDNRIATVVALVMIIHRVGRAYATDIGMTDDAIDEMAEKIRDDLGLTDQEFAEYLTGKERAKPEEPSLEDLLKNL